LKLSLFCIQRKERVKHCPRGGSFVYSVVTLRGRLARVLNEGKYQKDEKGLVVRIEYLDGITFRISALLKNVRIE
jgi:hypothetical protein